jgi:Kef-type K+ transport system membrane component KefB
MICVGWAIFLLFPGKMALLWLARHTGSIQCGPTMFFISVTILLAFGSAFFTDVIGVHAIFGIVDVYPGRDIFSRWIIGAFLVGIIVPREGGLAIALTESWKIWCPSYFFH